MYAVFSALLNAGALADEKPNDEITSNSSESREDILPDESVDNTSSAESTKDLEKYNIQRVENPDNPCDRGLDTYDYEKTWYDDSQIYINSVFCEPALWFDNFFGNDRLFDEGVAGTYVRWRNDFTYAEDEDLDFKTRVNFSIALPGVEDRLRLTFEADENEELNDIVPGAENQSANTLGLQVDIRENERSKLNVKLTLSPKLLLRYRYTYPVKGNVILRFTQEVERDIDVHNGRTTFEYEHPFKQNFLFRSSTQGAISEEYDGVDWVQAFVVYQRINKKTSLSYESSANGVTQPSTRALNYRAGIRFRRNFHREWLFYEISPAYTWPIMLGADRQTIYGERHSKWVLFMRLEVHFGNIRKVSYQQ